MKQVCRTWSGAVKGPGRSILAHPCYVSGLCRLDDRRIVTCGADKLVRLWDVMAERDITPEPSGAFVVGSGGDGSGSGASRRPGTDSAGGLDRGALLWALPGHTKGVDCCCVVEEGAEASYPYGGHVITGGADGCVIVCLAAHHQLRPPHPICWRQVPAALGRGNGQTSARLRSARGRGRECAAAARTSGGLLGRRCWVRFPPLAGGPHLGLGRVTRNPNPRNPPSLFRVRG